MNNVWKKTRFCRLFSAPGQFWTTLGRSFWTLQEEKKGVFFTPPPPLSILEKLKMICHRQWYKATWWMALSYSVSQSFTLSFAVILSAFFFSEESHYFHHPPHFSQIRCICPCLAKGKKKPFLRSWIPFPCPHILCIFLFFMICSWYELQCDIILWADTI